MRITGSFLILFASVAHIFSLDENCSSPADCTFYGGICAANGTCICDSDVYFRANDSCFSITGAVDSFSISFSNIQITGVTVIGRWKFTTPPSSGLLISHFEFTVNSSQVQLIGYEKNKTDDYTTEVTVHWNVTYEFKVHAVTKMDIKGKSSSVIYSPNSDVIGPPTAFEVRFVTTHSFEVQFSNPVDVDNEYLYGFLLRVYYLNDCLLESLWICNDCSWVSKMYIIQNFDCHNRSISEEKSTVLKQKAPFSYVAFSLLPGVNYSVYIYAMNIYGKGVPYATQVQTLPNDTSDDQQEYDKTGLILGLVIAMVVFLVALVFTVVCCPRIIRKRNKNRQFSDLFQIAGEINHSDLHQDMKELNRKFIHVREMRSSDIQLSGTKLGSGLFGDVWMGQLLETNSKSLVVAVRVIIDVFQNSLNELHFRKLNNLVAMRHSNLVPYLNYCMKDDELYIAMESVIGGNLLDHLRHTKGDKNHLHLQDTTTPLPVDLQNKLLKLCVDVSKAMTFLASQKITHGNLAARNILIEDGNKAKVSDYGLVDLLNSAESWVNCPVQWMAVETIEDKKITSESDVWSLGVLLWEVVTLGEVPYSDIPIQATLLNRLLAGHRLPKPRNCGDELYRIMKNCWERLPSKRPTFDHLAITLQNLHQSGQAHMTFQIEDGTEFSPFESCGFVDQTKDAKRNTKTELHCIGRNIQDECMTEC